MTQTEGHSMGGCCQPSTASRSDLRVEEIHRNRPDGATAAGMVHIESGVFQMGNDDDRAIQADGEGPVREVEVSEFLIDPMCVTNVDYSRFVQNTGYVTDAERFGWSFVFEGHLDPAAISAVMPATPPGTPWWRGVEGATWRSPEGPGSNLEGRDAHPVVHVSWRDAQAYAYWASKCLPTEAQWEKAARGGIQGTRYPWGDELTPGGRHLANIWQGAFPSVDTGEDGYVGTAPVDAYEPNGAGLYNMSGNVWEWCADWWDTKWHGVANRFTRVDPQGPPTGKGKVIRGGSHLCHVSYCERYRVGARTSNTPDSTSSHTGFRCASSIP